jgi:transcriptional regulator with XRE-family HTH domain
MPKMKKPVSTVESGFLSRLKSRLFDAHIRLEKRKGHRVPFREMAELVTAVRGGEPMRPQYLSDYEKGLTTPSLETLVAIAAVTETDPGWLAFGSGSAAPMERAANAVKAGSLGEKIAGPGAKQSVKRRAGERGPA